MKRARFRVLAHRSALAAAALVMSTAQPSSFGDGAMAQEVRNPKGVAVIVGNQEYEHRDVPEVGFAHRDADAFRRYVVDVLGFDPMNVIDLRDTTRRELFDALGTRTNPHGLVWSYLDPDGGSDLVVYYSGHGVPGVNDDEGYLLPVDADPNAAKDDGYPINLLYENLGGLEEATSVQVYLDACFSGGSHEGVLIKNARPAFISAELPEGVGENVVSLTAASGEQVASWDTEAEHGLFTLHLLDALHGEGDENGDGRVTAVEAKRYLDRHMTRAARRQYRRVQVASLLGAQDMVLAAAPADGAFPARRALGAPDPTPGRTVNKVDVKDAAPILDLAAVTSGHAILMVKTTPPGVAVLMAGVKVGETPFFRHDLRAGTYTVTLEHPTHETAVLEAQSLADYEVLRIERVLERAAGKVTVITQPMGAWVEQEGKRLAETTPVTLEELPAGSLVLTVGAAGHRPMEIEVAVPKGGVALVDQVLEEIRYGTLTLELEPADARATLVASGAPYAPGMKLPEGEHDVRLTREGYREVSHVVAVSGDTVVRIVLEVDPQPFTVVTTPPDAAVQVVGIAEGYRAGMALPPGTYRVQVSADGWMAREATVRHGTVPTRHAVTLEPEPDPAEDEAGLGLKGTGRKLVQQGLTMAGFSPGPADGKFGPRTRKAIQDWQGKNRHKVTGYLTAEQSRSLVALGEEAMQKERERKRAEAERKERERQRAEAQRRERERQRAEAARKERERQRAEAARKERERNRVHTIDLYNGDRYVGRMRDGERHGQGTYTWASGNRYEGEWRGGDMQGRGTFTWSDGSRYVGNFRNDERHGHGTYTDSTGSIRRYEGQWRAGKPHGWGTVTDSDGDVFKGQWKEGCFEQGGWFGAKGYLFTTRSACGF